MVKPYSPHRPHPKQEAFLRLDAEEALFGGSTGGGKSDALISAALQHVDIPGYSAALFRRTKEDLNKPGNILDRARTWFAGTAAKWEGEIHGFRFPTYSSIPGATIHFGYAQTKQEIIDRYQGTELQFIGVDELTQWQEDAYSYLFSRLRRRIDLPVPTRMRAGSNPGGRGADWVRLRFVEHAKHVTTGITAQEYIKMRNRGETLPEPAVFESPPSSEAVEMARLLGRRAQGAYFVPSFKEDNPGLQLAEYSANLMRLTAQDRQQLEKGDWWATGGGKFFQRGWFLFADEPPKGLLTVRYWDLAATKAEPKKDPDWTAGVRGGVNRNAAGGHMVFFTHATRCRENPGPTENFVKQTATEDGRSVKIYIEQEPGSAGKNNTHNYASKVLVGHTVHGFPKTGSKQSYWSPLSADAHNGMVTLIRGQWNEEFLNELCALTDDDSHAHDDYADAAAGVRSVLLDQRALERLRKWGNR